MTWNEKRTNILTRDDLVMLLHNQIAAITIENFVPLTMCQLALRGIEEQKLEEYGHVNIQRIGVAQSSFFSSSELFSNDKKKYTYFKNVPEAVSRRLEAYKYSGDLLPKVIATLRKAWGRPQRVGILREGSNSYFAGITRILSNSDIQLHSDWVKRDAIGWANEDVDVQIALNLYLKPSKEGGELVIFNKLWNPEDETMYKLPNQLGYSDEVVEDNEFVVIKPKIGSLTLFNCRNYHVVHNVGQDDYRITFSTHMGYIQETQELALWA